MRNASATRLITRRVLLLSTLPPLMRLSGHSPSQEQKCFSLLKRLRSGPTSVSKTRPRLDADALNRG